MSGFDGFAKVQDAWQAFVEPLRRDRFSATHDDEHRQMELCSILWAARHAFSIVYLVILVLAATPARQTILVGCALALGIGAQWLYTRDRSRAVAIIIADALVLVGFAGAGMPATAVVIMATSALVWAATFRPGRAALVYTCAVAAVLVAWARAPQPPQIAMVAGFCVLGAMLMLRAVRLNMGARRTADRERMVANSLDAVLWEQIPGREGALKVSPAAERILGHPLGAWDRPGFLESIAHPDDLPHVHALLAGDEDSVRTWRLRHLDGGWRWMESRTTSVRDRAGRHAFHAGVLIDRTDQLEAEREALMFGNLVASSPIGQMLVRCNGEAPVIDAANAACRTVVGATRELVGTRLHDLAGEFPAIADLLTALSHDMPTAQTIEIAGADGRIYEAHARVLSETACSVDFLDITERVEHIRLVHAQARQDELTGLPNRRALREAVTSHLEAGTPVALLLIDLDDFKEVNDSLGHETGDQLLRQIGMRIRASAPVGAMSARLGGDEFALLLPGAGGAEARAFGTRLVTAIAAPVVEDGLALRVRSSVGIATYPEDATDTGELMRRADVAMYRAKRRRSRVEVYDADADPFGHERLALVADLEHALAGEALTLHHQPLVEVATGRIVGTEVLARWNHPRLGNIPPETFIEIAEVSNQIGTLTRWVIRQALADLTGMPGHMDVSVNLSVRNLYEQDLLGWLAAAVADSGVAPHRLVLEITESTVMDDQTAAMDVLEGIRRLGVRTWIDDFGTGHSSFSRLRSLPVDGVKIDRSFLYGARDSDTDRILLHRMIDLVLGIGLQVIVEGVETAECLDLLTDTGCHLAQGYHLGRPMPLAGVVPLLELPQAA